MKVNAKPVLRRPAGTLKGGAHNTLANTRLRYGTRPQEVGGYSYGYSYGYSDHPFVFRSSLFLDLKFCLQGRFAPEPVHPVSIGSAFLLYVRPNPSLKLVSIPPCISFDELDFSIILSLRPILQRLFDLCQESIRRGTIENAVIEDKRHIYHRADGDCVVI